MERRIYELPDHQLDLLADKVSKNLIEHEINQRKRLKDNAYHNTRLLLRNYNTLKRHCSIVDEQLTEELGTLWSDWRYDLGSLLENKAKTAKLMRHVDRSLEELKKENDIAYHLIKRKYLTPMVDTDDMAIAMERGVDRSTVTRQLKTACSELATLLFGVDMILLKVD